MCYPPLIRTPCTDYKVLIMSNMYHHDDDDESRTKNNARKSSIELYTVLSSRFPPSDDCVTSQSMSHSLPLFSRSAFHHCIHSIHACFIPSCGYHTHPHHLTLSREEEFILSHQLSPISRGIFRRTFRIIFIF